MKRYGFLLWLLLMIGVVAAPMGCGGDDKGPANGEDVIKAQTAD